MTTTPSPSPHLAVAPSAGTPSAEPAHPVPPWDSVGAVPHSPLRARLAEKLFRHAVRTLPVRVALAGGERLGAGGPGSPLMRIPYPQAFFHRLGVDAKIGFGESYMVGDWTSPEPADVLTPFAERLTRLVPRPLQTLRRWVDAPKPGTERNTAGGARHNIQRHYDLSNDLFATFLDETMTYSAGLFRPGVHDLTRAQRDKVDRALDVAGVRNGTRLLEIGTGWGALALQAARRGARVTTLTLSEEQRRLARERTEAAGLSDRVDVQLCDYRHATGRYEAVVSIEMIEAVGHEYWPTYLRALDRLLTPGGRAAVQAITMPHDRMLATRNSYTWIHKYIFPGGQLPSVSAIEQGIGTHTGLSTVERRSFGAGYAETLRQWRARFLDRWDEVAHLGFGDTFRRMWEFYLAYSEAGYLDVWQFGFHKPTSGER
ncbi:cyclopropane-fatty-acyl-phospholipid synthase family protein [Haloactinomyces albus]|uniref:Cyclopropane-fatty-acyl-phospholipid synthase n=1 Tax=Haloactinomyces albus TaxID=1352928 RepID=A0AAE3Z9H8_9ACTN|nr:cyclopropane-fatty-acyl-phospholipid synthase family protein [Haloactinomyces albus]MDR7300801.1 cyclopropane-fatty-acyl-phospholipid synthase [Haloactinomyces albus]